MTHDLPSTVDEALETRREAVIARGQSSVHPGVWVVRGEGARLTTVDGRELIDFTSGIGVVNTGHRHPTVISAVKSQLEALTHICLAVAPYEIAIRVAERLVSLWDQATPKKAAFFTTGVEAVENAVKIARSATGRPGLITFDAAFHGRTLLGMAMTGKVQPYKAGFGPFPAHIYRAPYPYPFRGVTVSDSLHAIERMFKVDLRPEDVAAVVVEPIIGEGGFIVPPDDFLPALRELCDRHGILLVIDEIQTGFGRTGSMFAFEHAGVVPDLVTMAKGLGGGFPLSAVVGRADLMDAPQPGGIGGTFAGSPLSLAAADAVLDVIEGEKLVEAARAIGEIALPRLQAVADTHPEIGEVRGRGAMLALEIVTDPVSKTPDAERARAIVVEAQRGGLLALTCGADGNVIRFLIPLIADSETVNEGLNRFENALESVAA